jgi:hypothetical protein
MARQSKRFCVLLAMALAVVLSGVAAVAIAGDDTNQEIISQVIDALKSDDPDANRGDHHRPRFPARRSQGLVQELPAASGRPGPLLGLRPL